MQSGPYEYKNVKRLKVFYPEFDDKHEYREPILCRARDMGKVIYGKWIIGGEQWSIFEGKPYADDEEMFYTAYKLVGGARIFCNFELEEGKVPCTTFDTFADPFGYRSPEEAERLYIVDKAINNYLPVCSEPETDVLGNGMIYIKMPSGVETKQADDVAEAKVAGRPQLQDGDIIRVELSDNGTTRCFVVWDIMMKGVYVDSGAHLFAYEQIVAVYRFDGLDFKCIWESGEGWLNRFKNSLLALRKSTKEFKDEMEKLVAAIKKSNEKAGRT